MILRDYQQASVDAIWGYFGAGNSGNPVVALPTGTGKSLVIAGFIKSVYEAYPTQRVMMLTHVKELIEQNYDKLLRVWPTAPAGIYSAGVGRKDTSAKITFGGIQSVVNKPGAFGHVDLIIIDECHLVSPKASTSYQKFILALKEINPFLRVIGLSATPYRLGIGQITDGGLFTDICFDLTMMASFNRLIQEGYLAPLVPKRTNAELELDEVRIHGGEFVNADLQKAVDKEEITYRALQETLEYGTNRRHWLVFATGIEHATNVSDMLESLGVPAAVIHSKLGKGEREQILKDYRSGKYRALVNNNVLTTGFDFPEIDLIVMLRPTQSPGLWVQMLGRGTRPVYSAGFDLNTSEGRLDAIRHSTKQNCLVLDFAGNTKRLGPVNDPVLPKKKGKGGGMAPVRCCEQCGTYMHASVRVCTECGYEFPINVKFGFTASTAQLIAGEDPVVELFTVDRVVYTVHKKDGRPDSIKASYFCGLRRFTTHVCLEHSGFASKKAREWWRKHQSDAVPFAIPETTDIAISQVNNLAEPNQIRVWVNKKHPEILDFIFTGDQRADTL